MCNPYGAYEEGNPPSLRTCSCAAMVEALEHGGTEVSRTPSTALHQARSESQFRRCWRRAACTTTWWRRRSARARGCWWRPQRPARCVWLGSFLPSMLHCGGVTCRDALFVPCATCFTAKVQTMQHPVFLDHNLRQRPAACACFVFHSINGRALGPNLCLRSCTLPCEPRYLP